jgi:hypothetical protein
MLRGLWELFHHQKGGLLTSRLFDQTTFYDALIKDFYKCKQELVIESPFITSNRVASLLPIFEKMRSRQVRITVNTRHPSEHNAPFDVQAWMAIEQLQEIGVQVLFTGGHHRKIAILDKEILWEGSLNILSQNQSCEIMRRITSPEMATEMIQFIRLDKFLS